MAGTRSKAALPLLLLRRWVLLRLALMKAVALARLQAVAVGFALALFAIILVVIALIFALLALAEVLQTIVGLSAAVAHLTIAAGMVALALLLALWARSLLRRGLKPSGKITTTELSNTL